MATDEDGVHRLMLQDHATYPDPLLNLLQYHAIGACRDRLLEQTALRLGQQLGARGFSVRAVVSGLLAALGLQRDAATAASAGPPLSQAPPPRAPRSAPPHKSLAPLQPVAAFRVLDETPRAAAPTSAFGALAAKFATTARTSAPPTLRADAGGGSAAAAEAFALASSEAAAQQQLQGEVEVVAERATGESAPTFAVSRLVDSWSCAGIGAEAGSLGETTLARGDRWQPAASTLEDRIDSLRATFPHRSTESLRELALREGMSPAVHRGAGAW
jgi:hypothetical protein